MTVAPAGVDAARPMTVAQKVSATSSFDLMSVPVVEGMGHT
jgi:hypothetical protein